jgi:hypothetical protein
MRRAVSFVKASQAGGADVTWLSDDPRNGLVGPACGLAILGRCPARRQFVRVAMSGLVGVTSTMGVGGRIIFRGDHSAGGQGLRSGRIGRPP